MKIFINGKDGGGWAVDMIRNDIASALKRIKAEQTHNFLSADIIHNIWWNKILSLKHFHLRTKKNIIVTAGNFINPEKPDYPLKKDFFKVNKLAKAWLVPSIKQKKIIEKYHKNVFLLPYYLNYELFNYSKYLNKKNELLRKYKIPENLVEGKIIIGSFQRDTLGSDLTKPKWQKGPELLINILKDLPKEKFVLLLAGSRRHYVLSECKKHNIPYFYIGKETQKDDIGLNDLPLSEIPGLYSLTDLYLVTSKSEGGPKAILEATAMKTCIMSTDVGLAGDFLKQEYLFNDYGKYKAAVENFVNNFDSLKEKTAKNIESQYQNNIKTLDINRLDNKLSSVYNHILTI